MKKVSVALSHFFLFNTFFFCPFVLFPDLHMTDTERPADRQGEAAPKWLRVHGVWCDVRYYLLRRLKVTVEIRSIKACDGKLMVALPACVNNGYKEATHGSGSDEHCSCHNDVF